MFIFIISVLVVSFISLCFFKKNFWENRYLILLICVGVALVATLTTNYVVRGKLQTKIETSWEKPIKTFYVNDTLLNVSDSIAIFKDAKFDFNQECGCEYVNPDTTKSQRKLSIVFYDKSDYMKIGYVRPNDKTAYLTWKDVYIAPSNSDTVAYIAKKCLRYVTKHKNWINSDYIPRKLAYTCVYIPPKEYAKLSPSLIKKLPF